MKIAINDKCMEVFKQLKFGKAFRYIVFKIDHEEIVTHLLCSWLKVRVIGVKLGAVC